MNSLTLSRHLLWKDYRQIRPALIGCWAIYAVILLLLFVQQLTVMEIETFFPQCIMLVLSAPTLVAMAASGILIGHERQTRSWNWSSSLPISWYSSMLSKFVVWLASSVVMVLTLGLVYLLLAWICRMRGLTGPAFPEWISPEMIVSTAVVVPLAVYICFSLAALLWNDTLTAFVVSACVVSTLYVLTYDLLPRTLFGNSGVSRNGLEAAVGIFFTIALLIGLTGYAMIRAYHWRWTQGQLASIGWRSRAATPTSRLRQQAMWQSMAWSGPAPSEFWMLLAHAMKTSLVTRLCVFIPTFIVASLASVDANFGLTFLASWVNALILGVTVFAGDQTQSSYKFFADRGVRWSKLLCAHTLPPLLLAVVPALLASLILWVTGMPRTDGSELFWLVPVTLAMFGVGLFCSLCSSIAMLSITLAVGALVLSFLAMKQQFDFWHYLLIGQLPTSFVVAIFCAQVVILCIATIILVRRWLVFDRVRGALYYATTLFVALVPVHLIAVSLCFLSVPKVPWPGMDPSQVKVFSTLPKVEITPIMVPSLRNFMFSTDPAYVEDAVERTYRTMAPLATNAAPQDSADPIPLDQQPAEKRNVRLKAGATLAKRSSNSNSSSIALKKSRRLSRVIFRSCVMRSRPLPGLVPTRLKRCAISNWRGAPGRSIANCSAWSTTTFKRLLA